MAKVKKDEPMWKHTSFRIGGSAGLFMLPKNSEELSMFMDEYKESFIFGGGSNILVADKGVPEVICLKRLSGIKAKAISDGVVEITAGSGYGFTSLSKKARELSLKGLEFAFGIPGTVGGAVVMNAGAFGGEVKDLLVEVELLQEGATRKVKATELSLSYRHSSLPKQAVIVSATFRLEKGEQSVIESKMEKMQKERKERQPLDAPSAGSIYKNRQEISSGKIIEDTGLKGLSVGDAVVSEKHANFILNAGKATAAQVLELMEKVEDAVFQKSGIHLEREIKLVGIF